MRTTIVAALFVLALAGGCGTALDRPGAVARRAGAAASPSAVRSSSPPFDRAALSARVQKVLVAPGALVGVGVVTKPEDELDADYKMSDYCNLTVPGETRSDGVVHIRSWQSRSIVVYNAAFGYDTITAIEAVASTRRHAGNCTSYERRFDGGTVKVELLDVVDLGSVAGIDDGYARCERRTVNNDPAFVACMAFLGRGKLLSTLNVWHGGGTAASTTTMLLQIVPIAAAALAAA
jgi:hypothetical protein